MQQSAEASESADNAPSETLTDLHKDLADILRMITRAEPLDRILERIASVIEDRFAIKSLTICLLDDESGSFRPVLVNGFAEDQARAILKHEYSLERKRDELNEKFRVCRDCYYIRAEELTNLYNDDLDYLRDLADLKTTNGSREWHDLDYVDLLMTDRLGSLIGWIEIDEPRNRQTLPVETIQRMQVLSDLAAIAVENSRMSDDAITAVIESQGHLDIIVHDIGSLIEPLSRHLDEMKRNSEPGSDISARIEKAISIVRDARNLVKNVHKLTEARQGGAPNRRAFDLKQVLVESIASIKNEFPEKDVIIDMDFPEEECEVLADELIPNLFSNILNNSVRYCRGNQAEIEIAISNGHDSWMVEISDHGIGIPDERKKDVFSRFAKGTGSANGAGLGLSIVALLVSRYNGLITLEDRVRGDYTQGTSFVIALPKDRSGTAS